MKSMLLKVSDGWAITERWLLVGVLLAMICLAVLQIVLRNIFGTSLFWIDPLNRLLVLWVALLGAMVATREREHIAVDLLKHYLKGKALSLVTSVAEGFAAVACGIMAYHSGRFVYFEYLDGMQTFSGLPAWPFELIMPVGFAVMCARFAFSALFRRVEVSA